MNINEKYIDEIANALVKNHAALMVGAGFSKNAEKITVTDKEFLSWSELADRFKDALFGENYARERDCNNILQLAQETEIAIGRPRLEEIIREAVPDLEYAPSDLYVKMMELPWKDIFTTNYDTLLERAADKVYNRRFNVISCQEDLVNSNDAPRIIKLHGSFPSHRPFIITEEDYRTYPTQFAALVNTVQQALLENVFCMLGFSCEDPNFNKWVGWIHDNLGMNYSQRIYMVSVSRVNEVKRKLLASQNIIVVDLEELWPEKHITGRVESFIDKLKEKTEEKEERDNWFERDALSEIGADFIKTTQVLGNLNDAYPGWIFLPWKMKTKAGCVFKKLNDLQGLDRISYDEGLNFMYEYVRFFDIAGRPILPEDAEMFWDVLNQHKQKDLDEAYNKVLEGRKQIVYLHLLRSFRESAKWELYDECHSKINRSYLDYHNLQFLFVCDWWKKLYRFQPDDLVALLDKWDLAENDVYWPLIKGGLYTLMGEATKARAILIDDLASVRRQLVRASKDEFLSSVESCTVSLINFIRTGGNGEDTDLEKCAYAGDISWEDENEKYVLHLNESQENIKPFSTKNNFDLSCTYSMHFGIDNSGEMLSLEYLRFLEETGIPFRLKNVVNTGGLRSTIEKLAPFYPQWCMMQIIIARGEKLIDLLYGRVQLAGFTREQVDEITEGYLKALHVIMGRVDPKNSSMPRSIYEQAAVVLPKVVARLCYRCSVNMLDKILDTMLEICSSRIRTNFKGVDCIFQGLLQAYSVQEQGERIEKILSFPMEIDRDRGYRDPVNYLAKPKEKYKISSDLYDTVIFQISQMIKAPEKEKRECACNRFVILAQILDIRAKDRNKLCDMLEQQQNKKYDLILYVVDPARYAEKPNEILETTLQVMEGDSNEQGFAASARVYGDLIQVLSDVNIRTVNLENFFLIMENLVRTNIVWSRRGQQEADVRIKESFIIATGLLILRKKNKKVLTYEEKNQISKYLIELDHYLGGSCILNMIYAWLGMETDVLYSSFQRKVWLCKDLEFDFCFYFYNSMFINKVQINSNRCLSKYSKLLFKVVVFKIASSEIHSMSSALDLCHVLLENNIFSNLELQILITSLSKIKDETAISMGDSEQEAINKLKCRIRACEIAKKIYAMGNRSEIIEEWKDLSNDENEFIEVRNIGWLGDDFLFEVPYKE